MKKLFLLIALAALSFCGLQAVQTKPCEVVGKIRQDRVFPSRTRVEFYDATSNTKVGYIKFQEKPDKNSIYMHNLEVKSRYRNLGIGAILLQKFITFVIKIYPEAQYLEWQIYPYDRPSESNLDDMLQRLTNFYLKQGATVWKKKNLEGNYAQVALKGHPTDQFNPDIPISINLLLNKIEYIFDSCGNQELSISELKSKI